MRLAASLRPICDLFAACGQFAADLRLAANLWLAAVLGWAALEQENSNLKEDIEKIKNFMEKLKMNE